MATRTLIRLPQSADTQAAQQPGDATGTAPLSRLLQGARTRVALVRMAFGVIWAIDAWYKWQPAFQRQFAGMITRPARTAPAALHGWYQFWGGLVTPHAGLFGLATAAVETVIALCLLLGFARRPAYLLGAVFALLIWAVPESFGRFWTAGQTDLGTGIMYVFIFVALSVLDARGAAGGWSLDRWLADRVPFWRAVAEPS